MVYVKTLSDDTETLRCKTSFALFIPTNMKNNEIILEYNTPCLPPPPPPAPNNLHKHISIVFHFSWYDFSYPTFKTKGLYKALGVNEVYYVRYANDECVYYVFFAVRPDL